MANPFLDRANRTKNLTHSHKRSRKQESELARRVGGSVTPASGAGTIKGDVRLRKIVRIEAKTTKNASFSVTRDMVRKIEEAALSSNELPVIVVEFNDGMGKRLMEVAVCPTYVLDELATKGE